MDKIENRYNNSFDSPLFKVDDICTDIKKFQGRAEEYSEKSVNSIIDHVRKGRFDPRLFDPIKVRKNPENKKLYVLAGHSRLEAFKRLRDLQKTDKQIQEFCERTNINFEYIPATVFDDIDIHKAEYISAISNTLSDPEWPIDRAKWYRKTRSEMSLSDWEEEGKRAEWANRTKIKAYSYLDEHGCMADMLRSFKNSISSSETNVLEKIAVRTGRVKSKFLQLTRQHESEIYDRLITHQGYGTQKKQVHTYEKFEKIIRACLPSLNRHPDGMLNVRNLTGMSVAMKEYYTILHDLREKKKHALNTFGIKRRIYNKKVATQYIEPDLFTAESGQRIEDLLSVDNVTGALEYLEDSLVKLEDSVSDETIRSIKITYLEWLNTIEQKLYLHMERKEDFFLQGKREKTLF
ncbi:MAG: hypothetical protein PHR46_01915 [Candidatus Absconditabacteria bacterium]|nr:hypothetical protein [Candidatus Absconditabacteria bacterium]